MCTNKNGRPYNIILLKCSYEIQYVSSPVFGVNGQISHSHLEGMNHLTVRYYFLNGIN